VSCRSPRCRNQSRPLQLRISASLV
jgi:hypothetical protein